MTNGNIQKGNLSVAEACYWLGIARSKLYELIKEGKAPLGFKIGKRRLFSMSELEAWTASLQSKEVH